MRATFRSIFPNAPWNRDSAAVLAGAMQGKTNNVSDLTLSTGTAVTTLAYPLIAPLSQVTVVPTNTYAASLMPLWVDGQGDGTASLHHATATATASVRFTVVGG